MGKWGGRTMLWAPDGVYWLIPYDRQGLCKTLEEQPTWRTLRQYFFHAYDKTERRSSENADRSFWFNRNSNMSITEPWGMPLKQEASAEGTSPIRTWYGRLERISLTQFKHMLIDGKKSLAYRIYRVSIVLQTGYKFGHSGAAREEAMIDRWK